MKYIVTGAAGFIGRHLCPQLERDGHQVFKPGRGPLQSVPEADYVVHLAALTVRNCDVNKADEFLESNVVYTHRILEMARKQSKLKKFIHISTGEVYGAVYDKLHPESDGMHGDNVYTGSKGMADIWCRTYYKQFNLPIIILRPCDVYGEGMIMKSFMPTVIKALREHRPVPLYGDGSHLRQWLHVEDLVKAITFIIEEGHAGDIYNVPGDERISNRDVVEKIAKLMGKTPQIQNMPYPAGRGVDYQWGIDGRKIRKLGWSPRVSLEEGLRRLIEVRATV